MSQKSLAAREDILGKEHPTYVANLTNVGQMQ